MFPSNSRRKSSKALAGVSKSSPKSSMAPKPNFRAPTTVNGSPIFALSPNLTTLVITCKQACTGESLLTCIHNSGVRLTHDTRHCSLFTPHRRVSEITTRGTVAAPASAHVGPARYLVGAAGLLQYFMSDGATLPTWHQAGHLYHLETQAPHGANTPSLGALWVENSNPLQTPFSDEGREFLRAGQCSCYNIFDYFQV